MATEELINAVQIAGLAGATLTRNFAFNKLGTDPSFPKPFIKQNGESTLWKKSEILQWIEQNQGRCERRAVQSRSRSTIDNTLALTFLSDAHKKPVAIKKTQTIHVKEQHL